MALQSKNFWCQHQFSEGQEIWGAWLIAPVNNKKNKLENNVLNRFIHFQLQNNAPICPQITSNM
jgi:hypothetical protein